MNRCIANPRSPKLQDSKTVSLNAESARIPQSRAVSTQPGARLCGNGAGDSALGESALEILKLGASGVGDASVHRWRRSDATADRAAGTRLQDDCRLPQR